MTRSDCFRLPRPCLRLTCKYHLLWFKAKIELWNDKDIIDHLYSMNHTCCLDIAEKGGSVLEEVGEALGLTRERIRQIESRALRKLKLSAKNKNGRLTRQIQVGSLRDFYDWDPSKLDEFNIFLHNL